MRPVHRGVAPRTYAAYGTAIGDLEERLGIFCSYCERRLPTSLAVEHVSPKVSDPTRELDWTNFLLGCTNCNSVKADEVTNDEDFLWPDRDNTFRAFQYSTGGFVEVSHTLGAGVNAKAKRLMNVVGLNRHKKRGWPRPARRDKRWKQREATWKLADEWKTRLATFSAEGRGIAMPLIRDLALGYGFFSVWMTVFADDPEVCQALVLGHPGTAQDCFGAVAEAIQRPGGRV